MISTFSARKTTATIALRQPELVVTRLDIGKHFHVKEVAGHKFVLQFILFSLTFRSPMQFCHGGMGSGFEAETDTAGKSLSLINLV